MADTLVSSLRAGSAALEGAVAHAWGGVLDWAADVGVSHGVLVGVGAGILMAAVYVVVGLSYLYLDVTDSCKRYRVQPTRSPQLTRAVLRKLWGQLGLNGLVLNACLCGFALAGVRGGLLDMSRELPSAGRVAAHMAAFVVLEEVMFYYSHRWLHTPGMYARFHKLHHEFKSPIALASSYAHPVEMLIGNVLPLLAQPLMLRTHILIAWLWLAVATAVTQAHHSGYVFPWNFGLTSAYFHDYHHEQFNSNFGLLGVLDSIHGTDAPYRAFVASGRTRKPE